MSDVSIADKDFYEKIAEELRERMAELEPAVHEYTRLKGLLEAVTAAPGSESIEMVAHGTGPAPAAASPRRRGDADSGPRGYRASQVVTLLRKEPGLTRAQLAERLGIRVGYLYQLLPALRQKGFVHERDGSWFAAS
ncbi:MAG TPA: helix-turn-helix transcriptional regulator [Thermoleophilaceae bacterium]|jgi:CRP-like cAMP-binding protein